MVVRIVVFFVALLIFIVGLFVIILSFFLLVFSSIKLEILGSRMGLGGGIETRLKVIEVSKWL